MRTHRAVPKLSRTPPWNYCVAAAAGQCSGIPHGNVVHVDTCRCGAVRSVECNAGLSSSSGWGDAPDTETRA